MLKTLCWSWLFLLVLSAEFVESQKTSPIGRWVKVCSSHTNGGCIAEIKRDVMLTSFITGQSDTELLDSDSGEDTAGLVQSQDDLLTVSNVEESLWSQELVDETVFDLTENGFRFITGPLSIIVAPTHPLVANASEMIKRQENWQETCNAEVPMADASIMLSDVDGCSNEVLWQFQMEVNGITISTCDFYLTCTVQNQPRCLPNCCNNEQCQYCSAGDTCPAHFPQAKVLGEWVWKSDCTFGAKPNCGGIKLFQQVKAAKEPWTLNDTEAAVQEVRRYYKQEGVDGVHTFPENHWFLLNIRSLLNSIPIEDQSCFSPFINLGAIATQCQDIALYQWKLSVGDAEIVTCNYTVVCSHQLTPKCFPGCSIDDNNQFCNEPNSECPSGFPTADAIGEWTYNTKCDLNTAFTCEIPLKKEISRPKKFPFWTDDLSASAMEILNSRFTMRGGESGDLTSFTSHPVLTHWSDLLAMKRNADFNCDMLVDMNRMGKTCSVGYLWQWQTTVLDFTMKTCDNFVTCFDRQPQCIPGCCSDDDCQYCHIGGQCLHGESIPTNVVDCVVTEWTEWDDCTQVTLPFTSIRTRKIQLEARNGGNACPCLLEVKECTKVKDVIYLIGGKVDGSDDGFSSLVYKVDPDMQIVREHFALESTGLMYADSFGDGHIIITSYDGGPSPFNFTIGLYSTGDNSAVPFGPASNLTLAPNSRPAVALAGDTYAICGHNDTGGSQCILYNVQTQLIIAVELPPMAGCAVAINDTHVIAIYSERLLEGGDRGSGEVLEYMWVDGIVELGCLVPVVSKTFTLKGIIYIITIVIDVNSGNIRDVAVPPPNGGSPLGCSMFGPNTLVVCGGVNADASNCFTLAVDTMQWGSFPSLQQGRMGLSLVNWKGQLLAMGGQNGDEYLSSIEVFDGAVWSLSTMVLPTPIAQFGAAIVQEKVL